MWPSRCITARNSLELEPKSSRRLEDFKTGARIAYRVAASRALRLRWNLGGLRDEVPTLVEAVNDALSRLQQALEHERAFNAEAAHALRTPLAVLTARLDAMPGDTVADLRADVSAMTSLVNQMLASAQADALHIRAGQVCDLAATGRAVVAQMAGLGSGSSDNSPSRARHRFWCTATLMRWLMLHAISWIMRSVMPRSDPRPRWRSARMARLRCRTGGQAYQMHTRLWLRPVSGVPIPATDWAQVLAFRSSSALQRLMGVRFTLRTAKAAVPEWFWQRRFWKAGSCPANLGNRQRNKDAVPASSIRSTVVCAQAGPEGGS
jgi:hypothetical protein